MDVPDVAELSIADVPTVAQFLASKDVIYDDDHNCNAATVARIGKYVMKYNGRTRAEEGDALRYLAANTTLPVPRCYGSGILPDSTRKYVIMDFVEGETLEKLWPDLSDVDKDEIVRQLQEQIAEYRALPPSGYIGAVVKARPGESFFRIFDADHALGGPFRDATHFKDALATRLGFNKHVTPQFVEIMRMSMDAALGDFRTVFTHCDLSAKNIIVSKRGTSTSDDGSSALQVTIIDWATAGWYPEWWEWCHSPMWFARMDAGWVSMVPRIVPVYAKEFWCWRLLWTWIDGIS